LRSLSLTFIPKKKDINTDNLQLTDKISLEFDFSSSLLLKYLADDT